MEKGLMASLWFLGQEVDSSYGMLHVHIHLHHRMFQVQLVRQVLWLIWQKRESKLSISILTLLLSSLQVQWNPLVPLAFNTGLFKGPRP